eukprot:scaffold78825_cov34-Prasinocladus_malaysianus.AAC.1
MPTFARERAARLVEPLSRIARDAHRVAERAAARRTESQALIRRVVPRTESDLEDPLELAVPKSIAGDL